MPDKWLRGLPTHPGFHFITTSPRTSNVTAACGANILGDYIPPQTGRRRNMGSAIRALDNRFSLRVTRYETSQDEITDARMAGVLVRPSIWRRASPAHSRRASSIPSLCRLDSPKASPAFKQ